jgi:para-nitrobenzyl esterase
MPRILRLSLLFLTAGFMTGTLIAVEPRATLASCAVTIANGDVQGLDLGSSCMFLGIPYAAPPTGALRWKPPQPAAPWTTPFPATTMVPNCPNILTGTPAGNEDCLKLIVWMSKAPAAPAPVIVWLHTGGFVGASANSQTHNGRRLAEETGAIIVAPNYRLGPLGFLVHQALANEDPQRMVSGNYGLIDQRAALQWVRDNIAAFGGDPNNVTVAGTSAGGDSVGLQMVSPGSAGLFHRAAIHSGTPTIRWPTHAESIGQGDAFATALGCVDPATVASCMRSKTRDAIMTALPMASTGVGEPPAGRVFWQPVVDGLEIPDQPRVLFERGRFHYVPTIVGFVRDEGAGAFISRTFSSGVTLAQYQAWLGTEFGAAAPAVAAQYPAASYPLPVDAMAQVVGDGQFVCEGRRMARSISDWHVPVYFFSYEHVIDDIFPGKVIHGVEANMLFGNNYMPNMFPNHVLNADENALHAAMAGYWTRFMATGDPNTSVATAPHWPAFKDNLGQGRGSNKYIVLDTVIGEAKRPREAGCDFWEPFFLRTMMGKVPAGLD